MFDGNWGSAHHSRRFRQFCSLCSVRGMNIHRMHGLHSASKCWNDKLHSNQVFVHVPSTWPFIFVIFPWNRCSGDCSSVTSASFFFSWVKCDFPNVSWTTPTSEIARSSSLPTTATLAQLSWLAWHALSTPECTLDVDWNRLRRRCHREGSRKPGIQRYWRKFPAGEHYVQNIYRHRHLSMCLFCKITFDKAEKLRRSNDNSIKEDAPISIVYCNVQDAQTIFHRERTTVWTSVSNGTVSSCREEQDSGLKGHRLCCCSSAWATAAPFSSFVQTFRHSLRTHSRIKKKPSFARLPVSDPSDIPQLAVAKKCT